MAFKQNIPWPLVLAYAADWLYVIIIAAIGGGISYLEGYKRPFSLVDLAISNPYEPDEIVSTGLLVVLSLIIPAIVIGIVVTLFFPAPNRLSDLKTWRFWQRKIWEGNIGVQSLCLAYAIALVITQVVKVCFGKPRPDFLSRCDPDLSAVQRYTIGGEAQSFTPLWSIVDVSICQQQDRQILKDGFKAYFSGHSSSAFAGLLFLSLWLAVKCNVTFPYVQPYTARDLEQTHREHAQTLPTYNDETVEAAAHKFPLADRHPIQTYRRAGAAPPVWGVIVVLIPVMVAIWITATRYQQFRHDGFDCISGSACGIFSAWVAFRLYHSSITRGQAWTYGPRSRENAFAVVTTGRYRSRLDEKRADASEVHKEARLGDDARPSSDVDNHVGYERAALHGGEPSQRAYDV